MPEQQVSAPFAAVIREKRVAIGMTQDQLASRVGCPQQTIEKIETGKTRKSGYFPVIFSVLGLDLNLLTGAKPSTPSPKPRKFVRSSAFRFYVRDWREFMGASIDAAAKAAGLPPDEYQAHEVHPINFTIEQIFNLANTIGVRGDQFWFPPPKRLPEPLTAAATRGKRSLKK